MIAGTINAQTEPEEKNSMVNVTITVVDDNESLIPNAKVIIGDNAIYNMTDGSGTCSFQAYTKDFVSISASGYDKKVVLIQDIINNNQIKLSKSKLFMSSDDDVNLPYMILKKGIITGSSTIIKGSQLEKYPTIDLRNSLTGLAPGLRIIERDGSPGFSVEEKNGLYGITEKISVSSRGYNMIYIIDGLPMDITEMPLESREIESVTVIRDIVGKSLYGPAGAKGILLIKTRRGKPYERIFDINIENGISSVDRFPGWVSGADYARLNNQARINDNLDPNFSDSDIAAYAKNDPYDFKNPNIDFRDMLLKNTRPLRKVNAFLSGGDNMYQYSSFLGYSGEGDIYKIGPTADYNRLNARTNLDIRINEYIKIGFDIFGGLTFRRSPNYGYTSTIGEGGTQMDIIEFNSVIPQITTIPPIEFPVYANNDASLKEPWYAVSSRFPYNPVGNIMKNGFYTETSRMGNAKATLDFDLVHLLKGLKSQTYFSYYGLNLMRIGKAENYPAYIVTPASPNPILSKVYDAVDSPDMQNLHDYYFGRYGFYENLNYENNFGIHNIYLSLTYFINELKRNGFTFPKREQNVTLSGIYSINDKYNIHGVLNYAGTYSLPTYNLFPSIGVSWSISEESFMSNINFIDYLKLRLETGILGIESFRAPYYDLSSWSYTTGSVFGPYPANTWFGTNQELTVYRNYPGRIGNPDLTWEKTKEFSAGVDALLFNQSLSLEISYFNNLSKGLVSQLGNSIPAIIGVSNALPLFNHNEIRYYGLETGIQYSSNNGALRYSFGGNATIMNSKLEKYDEPDYRYSYQSRIGKAADTYWGLVCLGRFQSDDEAANVLQNYDLILKAGDLKYKDMNGDGFIDDNDMTAIGHTSPRIYYDINININYKNFELYVLGTGCGLFDIPLTNKYFFNGWGDNNYSNFVKDNIGKAYPRLTYYIVNNNFRASDFWLTKGDYFKLKNVELAYTIPATKLQTIKSGGIRLYLRGANLLTLTKVKDIDPESINSGITVYPLYKTYTGGIKLTF